MCVLGKTKQIVRLGKPVLTIIPIANFQGEKRQEFPQKWMADVYSLKFLPS
jgi:hypothetical protein